MNKSEDRQKDKMIPASLAPRISAGEATRLNLKPAGYAAGQGAGLASPAPLSEGSK